MKNSMDEQEAHLALERMAHFLRLERGLMHVDREVPLQQAARTIPKRDHIRRTVDAAESAVEFLNPFVPGDVHGQVHRSANLLCRQHIAGEPLQVPAGVRPWWNPGGFKKGDVDQEVKAL